MILYVHVRRIRNLAQIRILREACLTVHHSLAIDAIEILLLLQTLRLLIDGFSPLLKLCAQLIVETLFEIALDLLFLLLQTLDLRGCQLLIWHLHVIAGDVHVLV